MSHMLTRSKFNQLINTDTLECRSCGKFWGKRENMYLCSKCAGHKKTYKDEMDFDLNKFWKSNNIKVLDQPIYKHLLKLVNHQPKVMNLDSKGLADMLYQLFKRFMIDDTDDKYTYFFSDEQASELIKAVDWRMYNDGYNYRISHAIQKFRITPWSKKNSDLFHNSSFCYFGNYMELPKSEKRLVGLYQNNLSSWVG